MPIDMLASSQQHLQQQQRSNLKRSGRRRTMGKMSAVPSLLIVGFYAATIMLMSAGVVLVSAQTATVTPVEKYFLPIGEAALLESMDKVNYRAAAPLNSMNSITIAADGTYIWYDHWEDGFETSTVAPTQPSSEIWGDNNAANGCAPGIDPCTDANDYLNAGDALILENWVPLPRDVNVILYDGGDMVQASYPIAVTRGVHSGGSPGALLGGAVEVSNTKSWGQNFRAPVGLGMSDDSTLAYSLTDMYIQASEENTQVTVPGGPYEITKPDGGTVVISNTDPNVSQVFTIGQGETLRIEKIKVGDLITTSKPAQVDLVTGDLGSNYEMRWYSLLPEEQWTNDYYTPLSEDYSRVYMYNPNDFSITVNVYMQNDAYGSPSDTVNIGANSHDKFLLPSETSSYRFESTDGNFFGVTQTDDYGGGQRWDWGHPLIPADNLTSKVVVGLAYGCKNNACPSGTTTPPNVVWITAADGPAIVTVDYNTDGSDVDTFTIDKLESLIVYGREPLLDMTGATISALDASGNEIDLAVAWGQKHNFALSETYNLDMGTVINPLPYISALKSCALVTDNDGDGKVSPGDELRCTIRITNTGQTSPDSLQFCESLNTNVTYVPDSTTQGTNDDSVADPVPLTTSTLDPDCLTVDYTNSSGLPVGGSDSVSYNIIINDLADLPNGLEVIEDSGTIKSETGQDLATFDTRIQIALTPSFELRKTVSNTGTCPGTDSAEVGQGATATFCFQVVNTGNTALNGIVITDPQLGTQSPMEYTGTIPIGGTWDVTATITATEPMINTASATANPAYPDGEDISYFADLSDTDQASFTIAAQPTTSPPTVSPTTTPIPDITIQKTVSYTEEGCYNGTSFEKVHTAPNTTIYWCLNVTNNGETPLEGVTLYDAQLGLNIEDIGASGPAPAPVTRVPEPTNPTKTLDGSGTTIVKRKLRGQQSGSVAESPQLDFLAAHDHGRHLATTTCSDAQYDERVVLLSSTCGADATLLSCYRHYIAMKDNPKNVDINMKHFTRFDETALDTCPSDKPDFWIALEYWGSTTAYDTCDHLSRKCGETKDTNDVQCLQHPDDSRLWYSRYKVHVHTVAATQELDNSLTCDAMASNPSVCTFEYAIDCTDPSNAEPDFPTYTPGLIHTLFSATEKPSSAPSLQPSSLPSASPTTGATFLQPGDSYTTVIAWNSEEPMVNIAKTWGYGPNGEYVSSEDQAEATIIGEQVVFAQEASVGQLVFVDESMASEAPSAMPTVSSAPSSDPSAKPSAEPSLAPSISKIPTASPVAGATASPSVTESSVPSALPSSSPSSSPVIADSPSPSALPSSSPSDPTLPVLPQMSPQNTICHTVTMTATESFALSSFAFNLDYNGCVAVTVEYQINGEGWNTMCSAHDVYGNAPDMTIVNGDSCIEVIVLEGETVEFRLSTQPSNTCVGGTTGGSTNLYGVFLQQYYTYSQSECVMPP